MAKPTTVVVPTSSGTTHDSYVDWPAIVAGIVLASAISLLLLAFGAAIGLSFADVRTAEGGFPVWVGIAAALWLLWVQVSSFMAGGYLTGRMRRRLGDATPHEVDVRDGAHGLLVWAGALVVGGIIAAGGLGAVSNTVGGVASTAIVAASNVADEASPAVDPNAYLVDNLFRSDRTVIAEQSRLEMSRILLEAAAEPVSDADREYMYNVVSRETGLSQSEAEIRVDDVISKLEAAKTAAAETAETARRVGIIAAFLTAASLLVSAVGAHWAASMGGRHRDEGTIFEGFFRRY